MPQVIAAAAAAITEIATAVSAVAANVAAAAGLSAAAIDTVSAVSFALVSAAIPAAALFGAEAILKPKIKSAGYQTDFVADPQAGVPYAMGRTGFGGNIIFADVAGASNKYLTYVVALSGGGPINQVESFSANGALVTFSGEGATGTYANRMWQKTALGVASAAHLVLTATGTADTPADHSGIPSGWGSSQLLSGIAAAIWTLEFDTKIYAAGTPKPLWVLKGAPVYDPRLDSTYPGGSGSQRLTNRATWAYSENPYLHALAWLIGIKENGVRILGVGIPAASIDIPAFVAGANVADANGWKIGGVPTSADNKWDVLTLMLQAGAGFPLKLGGVVTCFCNTPLVSLATLTAADVLGEVAIASTTSSRTRINAIWPRYREETQAWQKVYSTSRVRWRPSKVT